MSVQKLDITQDHCPMTFVKTKLKLELLEEGDTLEVLLKEGEPLENVPRTAVQQGFQVVDTTRVRDDIHRIVIKKA